MLKLLIVDDEKLTRDSLMQYLPYESLGIEEVKSAKNGLEALEIVKEFLPDIILCDIRMPKMDGIEFGAQLRTLQPDCKIIFISAYADKEYLKSAINLKAVSYIEKPIQLDELTEVLRSASIDCLKEKKKKHEDSLIKNKIDLNLPYIKQKLLQDLINNKIIQEEIDDNYGNTLIHFPMNGTFIIAHVIFNWKIDITQEEQSKVLQGLLNSFHKDAFIGTSDFLIGIMNNDSMAFVFPSDYTADVLPQNKLLDYLLASSEDKYTIAIGIGPSIDSLNSISPSYKAAVKASGLQFYYGVNKIYPDYAVESRHVKVENTIFSNFIKLLEKSAPDKACKLINEITSLFSESLDDDICYVKNVYFKLLMSIFDVSREQNLISPSEKEETKYIWQEIANFSTLQQIEAYLTSNVMSIFKKNKHGNLLNGKIENIKNYIEKNYNDRNMSVQSIADNVYLSHTYLCAFFKKATGKTVNEYITEVRIEKAKELLKNINLKLYEITLEVGLADPNYFCSIFKKNTGLTPSEYRERYAYVKKA